MNEPPIIKHIRDILILPFTVTVVIPYLVYDKRQALFNASIFLKVMGSILVICGLILFLWTVYLFKTIGKGTLAPWTPTQKLVIAGPYQYCRNPMISGVFFILLGEIFLLNSTNILIEALIFFAVNTVYFILKEEPDLYKRFGEQYLLYKKNVPRWIPKLKAYRPPK